jgi:hypothetical protein
MKKELKEITVYKYNYKNSRHSRKYFIKFKEMKNFINKEFVQKYKIYIIKKLKIKKKSDYKSCIKEIEKQKKL